MTPALRTATTLTENPSRVRIVLASASPRRQHLLAEAGCQVVCHPSGSDELEDDSLAPSALALENAWRKARAVAPLFPGDTVLAADTVVAMDGRFFGKPADSEDAFRMLSELVGKTHEVVTGVALVLPEGRETSFAESSRVSFLPLTPAAIRDYLASIHPLDKAGSYAAQDDNGRIISRIEGSITNVIGLPMERLREVLGL